MEQPATTRGSDSKTTGRCPMRPHRCSRGERSSYQLSTFLLKISPNYISIILYNTYYEHSNENCQIHRPCSETPQGEGPGIGSICVSQWTAKANTTAFGYVPRSGTAVLKAWKMLRLLIGAAGLSSGNAPVHIPTTVCERLFHHPRGVSGTEGFHLCRLDKWKMAHLVYFDRGNSLV